MEQPLDCYLSCSSLLNHDSDAAISELPAPAVEDFPISTEPSTREEVAKAIAAVMTNSSIGLFYAELLKQCREGVIPWLIRRINAAGKN